MKGSTFAFFSVVSLVATSCSSVSLNSPEINTVPETFTAIIPDDQSRVYKDSDDNFYWTSGDEISVFGSSTNLRYRFDGKTGDNGGTFSKVSGSSSTTYSKYYAIYPYYGQTSSSQEANFTCTIPDTQAYVRNSFDPKAALMVATTDDISSTKLKFKNVVGYLTIKVFSQTGLIIRKMTLSGNSDEKLAGQGYLHVSDDGTPSFSFTKDPDVVTSSEKGSAGTPGMATEDISLSWDGMTEIGNADCVTRTIIGESSENVKEEQGGINAIVLDCGESGVAIGSTKETATAFTFAVSPVLLSGGFTIEIEDINGGIQSKTTPRNIQIERATIKGMAAFEMDMPGSGLDMLSFSVKPDEGSSFVASTIGKNTINILVPDAFDKSALIAEFTTSGRSVYVGTTKQVSGVTVNDFTVPITYRVENCFGESRDYLINFVTTPKMVACWGDSFTYSGKETSYPLQLVGMLGDTWTVYCGGIPSDKSNEIAARQGAIKTIIRTVEAEGVTLPASTSSVAISTICTDDPDLDPVTGKWAFDPSRWTYGTSSVNPCLLNGIECRVSSTAVCRTKAASSSTVLQDRTQIITYGARYCKDADVIVIYMGTNGGWQHDILNYDLLIDQHKAMINFTNKKKYIVLTSHVSTGYTFHGGRDTTYLKKMNEAFGEHVIHLRKEVNDRAVELLIRTGAVQYESEVSSADREAIAKGEWPASFKLPDQHPSHYGAVAMAILVNEKMKDLGYLDE